MLSCPQTPETHKKAGHCDADEKVSINKVGCDCTGWVDGTEHLNCSLEEQPMFSKPVISAQKEKVVKPNEEDDTELW